jgi:hypothetical protein
MRALVAALAALALVPAAASAQVFPVPQDVSLTGGIVATHSPLEKTVRFTVSNHGPGPVASHVSISLQVSIDETIVDAPGCTLSTVVPGSTITGRCELGSGLAEGTTQSIDARVRFVGIEYAQDYVIGSAQVAPSPGGIPQGDANGANNQVQLDLGIVPPPPAMKVGITVPGITEHGKRLDRFYGIENTGGHDITDVVVTDDSCPSPQIVSGTAVVRRAGGFLSLACHGPAPPHRKGEKPLVSTVTVTARSGGQTLTHTQTFTTLYRHPDRSCGTFRTRRKGKVTRWKTTTSRPGVPCKRVRKQLAACRRTGRAPKGLRCRRFARLVVIVSKDPNDTGLMRAIRS